MDNITGYVDICSNNTVSGWIANHDKPDVLETLWIWNKDGRILDFVPVIYRSDVCHHLSEVGVFGFSLNCRALKELDHIDKITDIYGRPLENGYNVDLKIERQAEPVPELPLKIFLHIQKTAGTSLRSSLYEYFDNNHTLYIYPDATTGIRSNQVKLIPKHQKRMYKNVMGHLYFGIGKEFESKKRYITILREPLKRIISNYYHLLNNIPEGSSSEQAKCLEQGVNLGLFEEFDNYMTRVISDVDLTHAPLGSISKIHLEKAIDNIDNHFDFISAGVNLDKEFNDLCSILGCNIQQFHHKNVNESYNPNIISNMINWDLVMSRNIFDSMLYKYVLQKNKSVM